MAVIIGDNKKVTKELEFQSKRVMHLAKRFIEQTKCRRCGNKKRKAVNLHEFGDPYLPSQVNIFCPECKSSDVFAMRPSEEAIAFAKMEKTGEATTLKGKPVETAEEMIDYAKHYNAAAVLRKMEDDKAIKDEKGDVIMNPDEVKKIDAKKKKK